MLTAMRRRSLYLLVYLAALVANPFRAEDEDGPGASSPRALGREIVKGFALGQDVKPLFLELKALGESQSRPPKRELSQVGIERENAPPRLTLRP